MMENVLKQSLTTENRDNLHLGKRHWSSGILNKKITNISGFKLIQSLTLDKFGFWEYLARFSLDKFINGPSGLVNIDAWKNSKKLINKYAWSLTDVKRKKIQF